MHFLKRQISLNRVKRYGTSGKCSLFYGGWCSASFDDLFYFCMYCFFLFIYLRLNHAAWISNCMIYICLNIVLQFGKMEDELYLLFECLLCNWYVLWELNCNVKVYSRFRVAQSLAFCVLLCRLLFVLLSFFLWPLRARVAQWVR